MKNLTMILTTLLKYIGLAILVVVGLIGLWMTMSLLGILFILF